MGKKALVVISFGTSHLDTRKKTIEACENVIKEKFKEMDFFRAWTSRMIISKLKKRYNEHILFPDELLEQLSNEGYEEIYIQSLHLLCGEEYNKLLGIIDRYRDRFNKVVVGRPLFYTLEDYDDTASIIREISLNDLRLDDLENESERDIYKRRKFDEAVVWMGHGTEHLVHPTYAALDYRMRIADIPVYIGAIEGHPEIDDVIVQLKRDGIKKIHLRPLLLVAGDHAKNDMAGDDEDSWKNVLINHGFEVDVHIQGLGEFEKIQNKFAENLLEEYN